LFKDDSFTYFGKNNVKIMALKPYVYKVNSKDLDSLFPNYSEIKSEIIRRDFYDLIQTKFDI